MRATRVLPVARLALAADTVLLAAVSCCSKERKAQQAAHVIMAGEEHLAAMSSFAQTRAAQVTASASMVNVNVALATLDMHVASPLFPASSDVVSTATVATPPTSTPSANAKMAGSASVARSGHCQRNARTIAIATGRA